MDCGSSRALCQVWGGAEERQSPIPPVGQGVASGQAMVSASCVPCVCPGVVPAVHVGAAVVPAPVLYFREYRIYRIYRAVQYLRIYCSTVSAQGDVSRKG